MYQQIIATSDSIEKLIELLPAELNHKKPISINLMNLNTDEQKELIGLLENYLTSTNTSYLYPYPIYIISNLSASISNMLIVHSKDQLPKLYQEKSDTRLNSKDQKVLTKNKLLQHEIANTNFQIDQETIKAFAQKHKEILRLDKYNHFLKKLLKSQSGKK